MPDSWPAHLAKSACAGRVGSAGFEAVSRTLERVGAPIGLTADFAPWKEAPRVTEHIALVVNGQSREGDVEPRRMLVQFLREDLELTGTHVGCDTSQCGACTVNVDGRAVKSCTMLAVQADGATVQTIEGMAGADGALHPLQQAR